jgi:hypothetical protein
MEENYLFGLVVFFLFSLVILKKEKKPVVGIYKPAVASNNDSSSASGVSKYLKKQEAEILRSQVTGVAKYLQEKEILNVVKTDSLAISGVAKYLATKEETPVSGVGKYMVRKAIHAKKMAKENVSGVEKYLNNRA